MEKALVVIIVLAILAVLVAFQGWVIMIIAGALGHALGIEELYISFWAGALIGLALTIIGSYFKKN